MVQWLLLLKLEENIVKSEKFNKLYEKTTFNGSKDNGRSISLSDVQSECNYEHEITQN